MADIVTGTVSGQVDLSTLLQGQADIRRDVAAGDGDIRRDVVAGHGDIRRDVAAAECAIRGDVLGVGGDVRRDVAFEAGNIRRDGAAETCSVIDAVKTSAWANSDRTGTEADRVVAQDTAYFIANQSQSFANATALAALKSSQDAAFANTLSTIQLSSMQATHAAQLTAEKNATATALGFSTSNQLLVADGNATRALINELKMDQLNRELIERNTALVECRGDSRHWQGQFNNSQYAQLVSQVNALNSQMTETRQGMVNFGTMAGVGQSSTSNNVR